MKKDRKPHFLEVFLPNLSSNRMKVPSKFVEHLWDRTSGSLSLKGPSGNIWQVNLFEYSGHLFFRDGWPTFVKDHSIQCGDTLVFRYDGNSNFTVQIFDESSCEKDEAFHAHCSQRASECNDTLGKKREREIETSLLKLDAEKKIRGSWVPVHPDLPTGNREQKLKNQKLKETVTSEHDTGIQNIVQVSDISVVLAMPALTGTKAVNSSETANKKIPSISKFIESRAAHYFSSTFPYFVRVICYSHITGNSTLKIPSHFSTLHLPNCRIKVTLMNQNGDCWIVNSIPTLKRHTRMHTLCGGWIAFVRANNIKIEDVCIFELMDEFKMRVRILRLGLEGLDGAIGCSSFDVDDVRLGGRCLEMIENVAQDAEFDPEKSLDQTNKTCTYKYGTHKKKYGKIETTSSIYTLDDSTAVRGPACGSASSIDVVDGSTSDELLGCHAGQSISYHRSENNHINLQARRTKHTQLTAEEARDTLSYDSPFPNFRKVMMSSNVGGSFTLNIPRKFSAAYLPSYKTEVILRNLSGDSWNVSAARYGHQTKFCGGWMSFVRMNDVKVGDVCVFELLDEKVLQVRVLEGSEKESKCVDHDTVADDSPASVGSTQCGVRSETMLQEFVLEGCEKEPVCVNDEITADNSTVSVASTEYGVVSET